MATGEAIPLRGLEGVPGLPGAPQDVGVDSHSLLQQIFPTQKSNQDLLHCRQILYQLMRGFISGLSILFHGSIFLSLCQYHTVLTTVWGGSWIKPLKALNISWGPQHGL